MKIFTILEKMIIFEKVENNDIKTIIKNKPEIILTVIFLTIIGTYLFIPPQVGMADSADFGRIISRIGLSHMSDNPDKIFFNYFNSEYRIVSSIKTPTQIGQVLPLLSVLLNKLFFSSEVYSIYFLSAIYYILYGGGFYFFLTNSFQRIRISNKIKWVYGGICIVVFSDIMFISYFNSFYQEALFIIIGLYIAAFGLARQINYNFVFILFVILSLSKAQNIIFLLFPLGIIILKYKTLSKKILLVTSGVFFFFMFFILKEQNQTNKANLYEAVFLGLMYDANPIEQKQILDNLNLLQDGFLLNVKKGYWRPNNELVDNKLLHTEFYSKIDQGVIMRTYLNNPQIFFKTAWGGFNVLFRNPAQPLHLGNYKINDSLEENKTIVLSFWGQYLNKIALPLYLFGFILGLYFINKKKCNKDTHILFILLFTIPLIYIANFVAGGINDFVKHNLSLYFMISILFAWIVLRILISWEEKKMLENDIRL